LQNPVLDPDLTRQGKPLSIERLRKKLRILRIRENRHSLIHDFLTDLVSTALFGECTAAFISGARCKRATHQLNEITNCLRLENDSVSARLDGDWILRKLGLLNRLPGELRKVDLIPVLMFGTDPSRSRTIIGPNGQRVVRVGRTIVREQSLAVAKRIRSGVDDDESGGLDVASLSRRLERSQCGTSTRFRSEMPSRIEVSVDRQISLRPKRRHYFR